MTVAEIITNGISVVFLGAIGYYIRGLNGSVIKLQSSVTDLTTTVASFKEHVAEEYMSKTDFDRICGKCTKKT